MSIVINDIVKGATFVDEQDNYIEIINSNVEKTWQSPKGTVMYNTLSPDLIIKASRSSIQKFSEKMSTLNVINNVEVAKRYDDIINNTIEISQS